MKGLIKLFANDIKGENFSKKEIAIYSLLPMVMLTVAIIAGNV